MAEECDGLPLALVTIGRAMASRAMPEDWSSWPTFPQIFIKGEFIGGSDIILNMHQNGELEEKLKDIAASLEKTE
ncbi:hypothetical protein EZV62_004167 [Acer yangbiense]|uniref:Glutaredoxin domain-containing protein n=1 Tax=Acer yangbiense TaxID=1000413 RepID=A0A5C7IKV0_9ROSI|nr:hypothetical protein EZV62_004167 [Acer yangbiense]